MVVLFSFAFVTTSTGAAVTGAGGGGGGFVVALTGSTTGAETAGFSA